MVDEFQKAHAFSDVEYARVLTKNGKLYSVKGTIGTVDIESFVPKEELEYAVVIHNHPVPEGEGFADAFSENDLVIALKNKTSTEYLVTGEKSILLNLPNITLMKMNFMTYMKQLKYACFKSRLMAN